jgi:hypothetical protein
LAVAAAEIGNFIEKVNNQKGLQPALEATDHLPSSRSQFDDAWQFDLVPVSDCDKPVSSPDLAVAFYLPEGPTLEIT